ncbi:putative dehydrogenase [Hydrogenispora ethanolica]|uniref:Putative dehydrogenase n=1 Tax=Hydrogenispora ethanolica TaxID=1082276 RepID=A0A4R1R8H9_HYDET|nr:Gfo/Idh/MocA family oxidoreductase [Hydrogenispora ethanolica]TCL61918.1 putative dehydrogenase [Hydrogenispora ethanolica]
MEPIRLGVIGCGIAARILHWPALQQLKEQFTIQAVCNHTEPKAKDFAALVGGVPYFTDYQKLLEDPAIEAVAILLPVHLNAQAVKDAVRAGKHVMVEKPLAASLEEAKELVELSRTCPQVTLVAENFRYRRLFDKAAAFLQDGTIGAPYAVFWNCFKHMTTDNQYAQTQWRIRHRYPGGFITDGGVHNMAALRDLFGTLTVTAAFAKCINPAIGELDSLSFQFNAAHSVQGVFNIFFSSNSYLEDRLLIMAQEGCMIIENNTLTVKRNGQTEYEEQFAEDKGYFEEYQDFFQAIRTGSPVKSSFAEAYADLEVIISALDKAAAAPAE